MESKDKKAYNTKYLLLAAAAAGLLFFAAILQLKTPENKETEKNYYIANYFVAFDALCNETYINPHVSYNCFIDVMHKEGFFEQADIWKKWYDHLEKER